LARKTSTSPLERGRTRAGSAGAQMSSPIVDFK
jgi:hypothetical protein